METIRESLEWHAYHLYEGVSHLSTIGTLGTNVGVIFITIQKVSK